MRVWCGNGVRVQLRVEVAVEVAVEVTLAVRGRSYFLRLYDCVNRWSEAQLGKNSENAQLLLERNS